MKGPQQSFFSAQPQPQSQQLDKKKVVSGDSPKMEFGSICCQPSEETMKGALRAQEADGRPIVPCDSPKIASKTQIGAVVGFLASLQLTMLYPVTTVSFALGSLAGGCCVGGCTGCVVANCLQPDCRVFGDLDGGLADIDGIDPEATAYKLGNKVA